MQRSPKASGHAGAAIVSPQETKPPARPPKPTAEKDLAGIVDPQALRTRLSELYTANRGNEGALRTAALECLKQVLHEGRVEIERRLKNEGKGLRCARRLSALQDEIIRVLYDFAATHLYRSRNPSSAERMAIVAVGGYGRGTLAPGSDIDLLFLRPYKQTPWGESVIEFILYFLWDLGFKVGHATRTAAECVKLARQDMTIRTALLEARFVWGDAPLYESFATRFDAEVAASSGRDFIAAKLAERDARHSRSGESRYLVEPNIKDGKGGLRDLQTLFWIAKYIYRVKSGEDLVKAQVFTRSEYRRFRQCEDFLWAVRCHLHFLTGRAEERLSFDLQREMAIRLGYVSHPGTRDVERFMKHYFLVAKDVGDLTRILCAALELEHVKAPGVFSQLISRLTPGGAAKPLAANGNFTVISGRLAISHDTVFEDDPVNLLRAFWLAAEHNLLLHPEMLKTMRRSLKRIDASLRADPEANAVFLDILTKTRDPEKTLRRMNEAGVLGRFVTDFGRIVGLVQFNMYHHYTVDEHLIRSIGVLAEINRGELAEAHPLSNRLIKTIEYKRVLYVALFLHDIAKGRPEDHSVMGAKIARKLCPRLGLTPAETETCAWLIEHHLDMSTFAQSRDLSDPWTITEFARIVQSMERLKLLLILTVADIKAVGPGVWNGWKGQLLRTLYYETEPILTGGHTETSRASRIDAAKQALSEALSDWDAERIANYTTRHYPAYWLRTNPDEMVLHARMIDNAARDGRKFAVEFTSDAFKGVTTVYVLAPDHPSLLSDIAGGCAASGAHIVDAQISTTTDGMAFDAIDVRRLYTDDTEENERARRIARNIEAAVRGKKSALETLKKGRKARSARAKAFDLKTQIIVSNALSDAFTVIEVSGLDRPGLLYALTRALTQLQLNIASAHVATFGERAVDVFYVTDLIGEKITEGERHDDIKRVLKAAFDDEGAGAQGPKAAA